MTYVTACTVDGQGGAILEGEGEGVRFSKPGTPRTDERALHRSLKSYRQSRAGNRLRVHSEVSLQWGHAHPRPQRETTARN